ncbi:hypothetical protein CBER1_11695 [Cercospora berteroae]|uniref:RRM domain-containing protein n=1 Tax=Cercospora berteroae TaxID=357750 RepID=A0A2S6C0E0_9PEZI|nr:hypothetical protein CBER1_11695 [Cercospora berteroae]
MMSSSRSIPSSGPFFVHIEGLPARYTWHDLKDLIKNRATHGLWADMAVFANGRPTSEGVGYARVGLPGEAMQLYQWLANDTIEGNRLRVHLWDISNVNSARFLRCNCGHSPQSPPAVNDILPMVAASLQWQPLTPVGPAVLPSASQFTTGQTRTRMSVSTPNDVPGQWSSQQMGGPMPQYSINPQVSLAQVYAMQQRQAQAAPVAVPAYNAYGMPVNMKYGGVRTEARGVYVSHLPYSANEKDIRNWFSQAGRIVEFRLKIDKTTKKSRGNCTIEYGSIAEAKRAIDIFHEKNFMDMKLQVRFDKAAKPVLPPSQSNPGRSAAGPLIVDSSRPYNQRIMAT